MAEIGNMIYLPILIRMNKMQANQYVAGWGECTGGLIATICLAPAMWIPVKAIVRKKQIGL